MTPAPAGDAFQAIPIAGRTPHVTTAASDAKKGINVPDASKHTLKHQSPYE